MVRLAASMLHPQMHRSNNLSKRMQRCAGRPSPMPAGHAHASRRSRRVRNARAHASGGSGGMRDGGGSGGSGNSGGGGAGGDSAGAGGLGGLWAAYLKAMETHPWPTKIATSAALNGVGDIFGQTLFEKGTPFDCTRFAKFTFLVRTHSPAAAADATCFASAQSFK